MRTKLISVDPVYPEGEKISRAAKLLRRGDLVAFPTETVYGLGGNALDAVVVQKIFDAKGRPSNNPLIVHVASAEAARALSADWPPAAAELAERFWPGPLTLVVKKSPQVPDIVTSNGPTVAVRVPKHPIALALLEAARLPLAAPSANRSTRLSPTNAQHVLRDLDGRIAMVLDGGPTTGGIESTVLDVTASPSRVLRPGLITHSDLERIIGRVSYFSEREAGPARSPGLQGRHYSPRATLECAKDALTRTRELTSEGLKVGCVTFAHEVGGLIRVLPRDPRQFAAKLYAVLHELDEAGVDRIVVELPPATEDWLAIRDRLRRAATPMI